MVGIQITMNTKDGLDMENTRLKFPMRRMILLIFVISLFITIISCGTLIYINWTSSANKLTEMLSYNINENIYDRVYNFMQEPYHINDTNRRIIENNMLDFSRDI